MITVSLVQFQPTLGDVKANITRLDGLIDKASGADLVVLPELASSGYHFNDFEEAFLNSEVLENSAYVEFLVGKAQEMKTHIVSGINERVGDTLYNSSILVNSDGVQSKYRKMHLFMNEKDIFLPGDGDLPVVDIGGYRVGMAICFDYLFPEIWRMQAMKGADIICHPSNLLTQNAHRCIPGLSLMNRVFILSSNRIGEERGLLFNGQSFVTNPQGEVLIKGSADQEELVVVEIDPIQARNKWVTSRNHAFEDRRPEMYD